MKLALHLRVTLTLCSVALLMFSPGALVSSPVIIDDPGGEGEGGGGGGNPPQIETSSRILDWSLPEYELSGSTKIELQKSNGAVTHIEVTDVATGEILLSMSTAELQSALDEDLPLEPVPPGLLVTGASSTPLDKSTQPRTSVCGGPFVYIEQALGSSVRFEGNLH